MALRSRGLTSALVLFLLGFVACATQKAIACECAEFDICTRVEKTPVIFLGEVIAGGLDESQNAWEGTAQFARLRIIEAFRGLPANTREVVIDLHFFPGMCSPMTYRKGQRTLVFVGRDQKGHLTDGICTSSRFADDVPTDLAYVRDYFHGLTKPSIRGSISAKVLIVGEPGFRLAIRQN